MRRSERAKLVRRTAAATLRAVAASMRKNGGTVQLFAGPRQRDVWVYLLELQARDVERRGQKGSSRT
jgi:hypothetical protein